MKIKKLTVLSVIIAVNLALSYVVKLPSPTGAGFVSLVEAGIFIAAWNFGPRGGAVVGGVTGLLLDLIAGYPQWMIMSLIIHGTEGYVFGTGGKKMKGKLITTLIGGAIMVLGYWLAGAMLMWLMGGMAMPWSAAFLATASDIPGNMMQVLVGFIVPLIVNKPIQSLLAKADII
ncbi:ECF transporter S component [Weissella viridescens]|uniref:ECF transporter S component n=1 Tax=Weissella viridescens TaxID=1629 RepID=A0A3P2RAC3_WEIVI|nr:ECF transporter S component [Weissella viridescens]RRG17737.1 ECF transporter S component [Weissella viridescens]